MMKSIVHGDWITNRFFNKYWYENARCEKCFFIINEDRISFLHRVGNVQVVAKQVQE